MDWDKYSQIFEWETNEINPYQNQDKGYYLKILDKTNYSEILELGAGSGRVTIPLLDAGYNVTALDYSQKMLERLDEAYRKTDGGGELKICESNMSDFSLPSKFDICIVTYSSFQHLMTDELRGECLRMIKKHLKKDGHLVLDLDPGILDYPYVQEEMFVYKIYNEELDAKIEMNTSWKIDLKNKIKNWNDRYVIHRSNGEKEIFNNHIALKYISLSQIQNLLESEGFEFLYVHGGFFSEEYNKDSLRMIVTAKLS